MLDFYYNKNMNKILHNNYTEYLNKIKDEPNKKGYINSFSIYNPDHPHDCIEYNEIYDPVKNKSSFINCKPADIREISIYENIDNISDILSLMDKYPIIENISYTNVDMKMLHGIRSSLIKLDNMIGMKDLKTCIIDQILYYLQNLHMVNPNNNNDYMHTAIYGPPGTGKTEIAEIIGDIFCKLNILKNGKFKKVVRSDLIAGYLGQTALKTKDTIKECLGGVMFIDEAYALGNNEKRDFYAKECIDTLCEAMSAHKNELMIIIAGYENEIKECFFSQNQGLESRFSWSFTTDKYTPEELCKIFKKKVIESSWKIDENVLDIKWFEKNKKNFTAYGRDMELLFSKVKIAHGRRIFCNKNKTDKTEINIDDLENGFKKFIAQKQKHTNNDNLNIMYT